jgi:hypothetical protein
MAFINTPKAQPLRLKQVELARVPWDRLDAFADRTVFQTREWIEFIAEAQGATPVVAEVLEDGRAVGYFTGLVVRRWGIRILGSSFPGWTTPYIGFNLEPGVSRRDALQALPDFAFRDLKVLHLEVSDPHFDVEDGAALGFAVGAYDSYTSDLTRTEDELFKAMDSAARRCVRKAEKSGVTIEEAHDAGFADEYYAQLLDVFAKQGLVPGYPVDRVRQLIRHLEPTGRILLLRARDAEGNCIGTGIYPGYNKVAEFWGNASWRKHQQLRPNETLHWYAIRYWKRRGAEVFDWGGGGTYKEKYGVRPLSVPWFRKARYPWLDRARNQAKELFALRQRLMGRWRGDSYRPTAKEDGD